MIKILLLGLGRWGVNHLRNLNSMPVELYVAEVEDKRLEPARKLGLPADRLTTDYKTFLSKVDCVVVVTPAQTHFPLCREFIEAGVDVFVEKPITLVSVEARQLAELAEKHKSILQVGHIFRFDPASQWLRDSKEDIPRAHDTIARWLPHLETALLIYDDEAGYRGFLAADVETGWRLRERCDSTTSLSGSLVMPPEMQRLAVALTTAIRQPAGLAPGPKPQGRSSLIPSAIRLVSARFYPELLDRVAEQARTILRDQQVAPFLSLRSIAAQSGHRRKFAADLTTGPGNCPFGFGSNLS